MQVTGRVENVVDGVLRGWAWDASRPDLRLDVTLVVDGRPVATRRADRPRGDLRRNGIGDGGHGLEFPLPLDLLDGATHLFVLTVPAHGSVVEVARRSMQVERRRHLLHGKLDRVEPLRVAGWVADRARPDATVTLELLADGALLARASATQFRRDLLTAGIGSGAHGFVFDLGLLHGKVASGTELVIRASAEFDHWELARFAMPPGPPSEALPTRPLPLASAPPPTIPPRQSDAARRLVDQARDAERRRDFARAATLLDEALAAAPADFELLAVRARVALSLNAAADAERFARAALEQRPGHPRPMVILARLASQRGEHAAAAELWSAIGPGEDNYRERLVKRGRALLALRRPREAMSEFAAAVALDPADRDAQRGLAEVAFGIGALATARRHWRRYQELLPEDAAAGDRLRAIEAILSRQDPLPSPLRNAALRDWPGALGGSADAAGVEPSPGLRLRSVDRHAVPFALGTPIHVQAGSLPVYGLSMEIAGEGAEAAFALDPRAAPELADGLRLGLELTPSARMAIEVRLDAQARPMRTLAAAEIPARPRLLCFDLALSPDERSLLAAGSLWLAVRVAGAGACELKPPRPLCRLPAAEASSRRTGFEDASLANAPWSVWQPLSPAGGPAGQAEPRRTAG